MEDRDSNMRRTVDFDFDVVENFVDSTKGKGTLRGEYEHGKSASSAFWDPRGRQIVSTSYDDTLRRTLVYLFGNLQLTNTHRVSVGSGFTCVQNSGKFPEAQTILSHRT
jgi:hypothetical protein